MNEAELAERFHRMIRWQCHRLAGFAARAGYEACDLESYCWERLLRLHRAGRLDTKRQNWELIRRAAIDGLRAMTRGRELGLFSRTKKERMHVEVRDRGRGIWDYGARLRSQENTMAELLDSIHVRVRTPMIRGAGVRW